MDKYVVVIALTLLAVCAHAQRNFYHNSNLIPYYYGNQQHQQIPYGYPQRNFVPAYYPQVQRQVYNNRPVHYRPYQQYYRRRYYAPSYKYDTDYGYNTDGYHSD